MATAGALTVAAAQHPDLVPASTTSSAVPSAHSARSKSAAAYRTAPARGAAGRLPKATVPSTPLPSRRRSAIVGVPSSSRRPSRNGEVALRHDNSLRNLAGISQESHRNLAGISQESRRNLSASVHMHPARKTGGIIASRA